MEKKMDLTALVKACFAVAYKNGFWDGFEEAPPSEGIDPLELNKYFISTKLALIHSEVSEALEALRKGDTENFEEEVADIAIRVFDLAGGLNIDLEKIISEKSAKNKKRPRKHGKRF